MKCFLLCIILLVNLLSEAQSIVKRIKGQVIYSDDSVIFHPLDSLYEGSNYLIYKNDTFNRRDKMHLLQGNGMWIQKDTNINITTSTEMKCLGDDCHFTSLYDLYCLPKVLMFGNYVDDRREGVWTEYWENGKRKTELTYRKGIIDGPINKYYITGELKYSGNYHPTSSKVHLKRYTLKGLMGEEIDWYIDRILELMY